MFSKSQWQEWRSPKNRDLIFYREFMKSSLSISHLCTSLFYFTLLLYFSLCLLFSSALSSFFLFPLFSPPTLPPFYSSPLTFFLFFGPFSSIIWSLCLLLASNLYVDKQSSGYVTPENARQNSEAFFFP